MLPRLAAVPALSLAALVGIAGLTGCSTEDGGPAAAAPTRSSSAPASTSPSPAASSSAPAAPTTSAAPSAPATSASVAPSAPATSVSAAPSTAAVAPAGGPAQRLLPAEQLPGFNAAYRWRVGDTRRSEPAAPFGTCQRFAMTSIGATDVAVRSYRPAAAQARGDSAGELVAQFPDSATARRAFEVLKSWRAKCKDQLTAYDRSDVGALQAAPARGGSGGWYLLTYGPTPGDPDSQFFDAQGMAVVGNRIAMVELILSGQDYNYPAGREPMVAAVERAAARLG